MDLLHLPLKVDDRGWLVRADRRRALVQLLRIMACTYAGTWAPDPEFGMRQSFESIRRGGLLQSEIGVLNRSLERLGMSDFRIVAVDRVLGSERGESSYAVKVISSDHGQEILEV